MPRESRPDNLKTPPQDTDAEIAVLGALMLEKDAIFRVLDILTPKDFYKPVHQKIYQAMLDLMDKHEPIDATTVRGRLKEKKELEGIGGTAYLSSLVNAVPTAANVLHYAKVVNRKRIHRDLISAASHISEMAYDEKNDIEDTLDNVEQAVFSISQSSLPQQFLHVKDILAGWKIPEESHGLRGVTTGFRDLDNKLSGLQKSDLIILAARPSLGKTSLALDIGRNAALAGNVAVGIFSLEMSRDQIMDRLISAEGSVELWKLRTGNLSADDRKEAEKAKAMIAQSPLYINDVASPTAMQIRAMARRLQAECRNLGLIIVDYLQLMHGPNVYDSRVQEVSEISRALKGLAKELNIPVLALSQLSRAVEMRQDPVPKLSDLRESGALEQDADVVLFIHRETRPKDNDPNARNVAKIHIAKHRNGPTGEIKLHFSEERASFSDHADMPGAEEPF